MRSSWLTALALSVFLGTACDDDGDTPAAPTPPPTAPTPPPEKAKAKAKAKAEVEDVEAAPEAPADPLADAKKAAWSGDAAAAATAFGEKLDQGPDAWSGLAAAARAMGDAAAAAGAVEGKGSVGDRALLLAEIKLAGGDAAGALTAALEARADQPDAVAAIVARAVKAGATLPESMASDDADPVAALARFVAARDARAARPMAEKADAVAGWRAAVLRGEVKAGWGDTAGALAEFEKAVGSKDPAAVVVANLRRAELARGAKPKRGEPALAPQQVSMWAADAALGAVRNSDVVRFNAALKVLRETANLSLRHDLTAKAAAAAIEAAGGADAKDSDLRHVLASSALEAGLPSVTLEQFAAVGKDDPKHGELARLALWANWELRDADGLKATGDALSGPHGAAARALHTALTGDIAEAMKQMPTSGLSEREFARLAFAGANLAGNGAADWLTRAARHADRTGDLGLRIRARLAIDHATRRNQPATAARALDEVARLVPAGETGTALQSELAARRLLLGKPGAFPEGDLPPVVKAWRSLAEGQTVTAEGPAVQPIAKWADGRAALGAGQGGTAKKFNAAVEALPLYRYGWLSTDSALDGSQGVPFADDLAKIAGREPTEDILGCALAAHEVAHVLDRAVQDAAVGRDLLAGMDEKSRRALLDASALVRAGMSRWHAGVDTFPAEAFEQLEAAEKAAASDSVFRTRVMASAPPALADVRRVNGKMTILSYVVDRGAVHGLVITPDGGGVKTLGDSRSILRAASEHATSLHAGAAGKVRASHEGGNKLRGALLDPFTQQLSGHGWYLVLGPHELRQFMFTTFPEQASGLRWLADIRTVAMLDVAARINITTDDERDPERFRKGPDMLAFASPAPPVEKEEEPEKEAAPEKSKAKAKGKAKAEASEEIEAPEHVCTAGNEATVNIGVAHRFFDPDFRETCVGSDAQLTNYFELAPRARYMHLDALEATARGGFVLGDGELDLTTVRSIPLVAELVIITADGTPEQQQQRARAFLDAGAQAVLFTGWEVPDGVHERMLDGFWAAVKRDKPISRANAEGRDSLLRDALLGEDRDNPGLWGSTLLYTTP